MWAPGIKEIWQLEGGCFASAWFPPGFGSASCKLRGWSDQRVAGKNEIVSFKARGTGVHHFLVNAWLKSRGNYQLRVLRLR